MLQAWAEQSMTEDKAKDQGARSWSSSVGETDACTIYQIRMWFGDPAGLRAPTICMRIDSRESLQRLLNVGLSTWNYDNEHMFRMTMPLRGDSTWGRRTVGKHDDLRTFLYITRRDKREGVKTDPRMVDEVVARGYDRAFVERIVAEPDAAREWPFPTRTVSGTAFELGERRAGFQSWDDDTAGSLSLEETALVEGDEIAITYDFGDDHQLTALVEGVATDQPLLPEVAFGNSCGEYPTRAVLVSPPDGEGAAARPGPQYQWQGHAALLGVALAVAAVGGLAYAGQSAV